MEPRGALVVSLFQVFSPAERCPEHDRTGHAVHSGKSNCQVEGMEYYTAAQTDDNMFELDQRTA